jgi:hypothetical protein
MGACSSKVSIVDAPGAVPVDVSGSSVSVDASGPSVSVDASGSLAPVPEEVVSSPVVVDEPSSPDSTIVSAPVTPILSFEALDTLIQKVDVVLASPKLNESAKPNESGKTIEPAKTNESAKTIEPAKPVFGAPMSRASSS